MQIQSKIAQNGKHAEQVGVEENKYGFGLGKANKDAKPVAEQKGIGEQRIISINNIILCDFFNFKLCKESLVLVQKDEGEVPDEKTEKKGEKSPEKNDRNIEKRIVNVDRNQVRLKKDE